MELPFLDKLTNGGIINDAKRLDYIKSNLFQVLRAKKEGYKGKWLLCVDIDR